MENIKLKASLLRLLSCFLVIWIVISCLMLFCNLTTVKQLATIATWHEVGLSRVKTHPVLIVVVTWSLDCFNGPAVGRKCCLSNAARAAATTAAASGSLPLDTYIEHALHATSDDFHATRVRSDKWSEFGRGVLCTLVDGFGTFRKVKRNGIWNRMKIHGFLFV